MSEAASRAPMTEEQIRAHERERVLGMLRQVPSIPLDLMERAIAAVRRMVQDTSLPNKLDVTLPEIDQLRRVARFAADAVTEIDDWLEQASTRNAAMDTLWRLRWALALYYGSPHNYRVANPLYFRGALLDALDRAGFAYGFDDEIRQRLPTDPSHQPATGPTLLQITTSPKLPFLDVLVAKAVREEGQRIADEAGKLLGYDVGRQVRAIAEKREVRP